MLDPRTIARVLGGNVIGPNRVLCPGPDHSAADRSLAISFDPAAPEGFRVHSFCGDDWRDCRKYILEKLGLAGNGHHRVTVNLVTIKSEAEEGPREWTKAEVANICRAHKLWNEAQDPRGTLAEVYLRQHRKLDLPEPLCGSVLRFHPRCPWRDDAGRVITVPVLVAPFRSIDDDVITGVQRVRLNADGSKAARHRLDLLALLLRWLERWLTRPTRLIDGWKIRGGATGRPGLLLRTLSVAPSLGCIPFIDGKYSRRLIGRKRT